MFQNEFISKRQFVRELLSDLIPKLYISFPNLSYIYLSLLKFKLTLLVNSCYYFIILYMQKSIFVGKTDK